MFEDLVSGSWFYQRILRKGEEKGEEKGREEGVRLGILDIVQVRFPELMDLAKKQVDHVQNINTLRQLHTRMLLVASREEAERCLLDAANNQ